MPMLPDHHKDIGRPLDSLAENVLERRVSGQRNPRVDHSLRILINPHEEPGGCYGVS